MSLNLKHIFIKSCFKLNKKIIIYISKRISDECYTPALAFDEKKQMRIQDFKIGESCSYFDKRTYCIDSIKEMNDKLIEEDLSISKLNKHNEDFIPLKLSFYFKKQIVFDGEKDIYDDFILYSSSLISFKRCSAQLVLNTILQGNFQSMRIIKIEECSISDPDFLQITQKLDYYHGVSTNDHNTNKLRDQQLEHKNSFTFNDVEISIKKCQYLTTALFDYLNNWDNNSFTNESNRKLGCGLSINLMGILRSTTLFQFSTSQYFKQSIDIFYNYKQILLKQINKQINKLRQLRKLKLKNHPQYGNSPILLQLLLSSRNFTKKTQAAISYQQKKQNRNNDNSDEEEEIEDEDLQLHSDVLPDDGKEIDQIRSNLERLSFDYSVCQKFDDLPLNSDYFSNLKSISYDAAHKSKKGESSHDKDKANNLVQITFQNMFPYSLQKLQMLKLKFCSLQHKFFSNIEYMKCVQNLQTFNFSYCQIDMYEFSNFIINSELKNLKSLVLRATNVDDNFCSLISDITVVSFKLEEIDISKTKSVSLKGVKYLTMIDSLKCLNIKEKENINCQLSTFLIDLMERKRSLFVKSVIEDIHINMNINLTKERLQEIEKNEKYMNKNGKEFTRNAFTQNNILDDQQNEITEQGYFQSAYSGKEKEEDYNYNGDQVIEGSDGEQTRKNIESQMNKQQQQIEKEDGLQDNKEIVKIKHPRYELLMSYTHKCPQIVHMDFSDCFNVTTPLFEDLYRHRLLNRLTYFNVKGTKVDNNLIDIFKQSCQQKKEGVQEYWVSHSFKQYEPIYENQVLEVCENQFIHDSIKFFSLKDCKVIRGFKIVFLFKSIPLLNLQEIDLTNCNVFDTTLIMLADNAKEKYPNLTKIKLAQVKSSPVGIKALRKLPANKIVFLDLRSTNFDDENSLIFFSDPQNKLLKTLQFLVVKDCKQLTTTGLQAMVDGLAGMERAEIYNLRFNVSEQEKLEYQQRTQEKQKQQQEELKNRIQDLQDQIKKLEKNNKQRKKHPGEVYPSDKKDKLQKELDDILKKKNKQKARVICENFDVFGLLQDCYQLVTDDLFTNFLQKLGDVCKNIFELNLNKMGRLTLNDFEFTGSAQGNDEIDSDIFKNLEIMNINETRITTNFVRKFLSFWISSNQEKKNELKMKNFMILRCQKAYFVNPSCLDVFKNQKNLRNILSKTHFKLELLLNELGLKIMDENLTFLESLKVSETRFVSINIKELNLENNQYISQQGFTTILKSGWMKYILRLNVRNTQFGNTQLEQMSQMMKDKRSQKQFIKLQYIGMRGCVQVSRKGLMLLCQMEKLNEQFDLGCICELKMLIDADLMKDMAQSVYCKNMEFLDLSENGFQSIDKGFKYLCFKGKDVKLNLKIINVSSTWISDKALQSLAVSENFNQLEKIILKDCKRITERGLSYLVDSKQLMNLDLQFLLSSNTQFLSGRVIDTLKYSDRKKTIKEISLLGSQAQDKEINNIMQEIISENYLIKTIDIRKTSNIGIAGLSYIFSMVQWNIVKGQTIKCPLQALIVDNIRYQEFRARYCYDDYMKQVQNIPDCKTKDDEFSNMFDEDLKSEFGRKFKPLKGQLTYQEFIKKCQAIYNELRHKIRFCSKPQKLNDIFVGDFIQNLFLSASNLNNFKYDFFIRKFALSIEDQYIDSLTLCDQKFSIFKDMESPNDGQQNQAEQNINKFALIGKKAAGDQQNNQNDTQNNTINYPSFENQFEYFDVKGNKVLCDISVCRFFLSSQMVSYIKIINISYTLLSEKVVLAICASPYLRDSLEVIYFNRCPKLRVKDALQYLLMTNFKKLRYKPIISQCHNYIDDEILTLILTKFKPEEVRFLNLSNSRITSKGLVLLEHSHLSDYFYLLDLKSTGIEAEELDSFMVSSEDQNGTPFPKNLRYMWLENTYNLTDESLDKLKFWKCFSSQNFDFMEMVQSKARKLNLALRHLANKELRPYIFKKSYIQLDIYTYIPSDVLITLINDQFYKEVDQFYDLKYIILAFRKQQFQALQKCFNWFNQPDVEKILAKYCIRITKIPQEYQNLPIIKLTDKSLDSEKAEVREAIQFDFHNYLATMDCDNILKVNKFVEASLLIKLDFQGTDITGNFFAILCKSIRGTQNRITEVSLKGLKTIRDEHIMSMMFDEQEMHQMQQNMIEIYQKHKTKKLAESLKKKEEIKKEIQIQIRKISRFKKFPFLVKLNIQNTKVTQFSLVQILNLTPFNMGFRIEDLFDQYAKSDYTKIDDHTINALSQSDYLQNFKVLNLENILCSSNTLGKLLRSPKAINIQEMILNTTNLSEDAFITLANSTNLPRLEQIKCVQDTNPAIRKSYHYIMRAQYLSMNLKTDEIMKSRDVMDTSQFIQAIMNSFYMNNLSTIEIHNANQFMQQIKSLFKMSLFTQQITKVILQNVADSTEYKDIWQMISVSKSFPRLQILNVRSLIVKEHLIILLNQKFKPQFDMESLLKDNKSLIDDDVIIFISKMPLLLNSKEIDLSDLSKISVKAWQQFANSKYVINLNKINFSDGTLLKFKTDNNKALKEYYFKPEDQGAGQSKCFGLFSQNNFFNLEKIDITNNRGLPIEEIRFILQSIKKRHVSVKFDFEDIFIQIIDDIKPLILSLREEEDDDYSEQEEMNDQNQQYNLQNQLWNCYLQDLYELFQTYFIKDREWYNKRHKVLDLTYFQFMRHFSSFQDIFRQISDLSCIETIKFYEGGFDSVFSSNNMKFLNLKNVKIMNLEGDKKLAQDYSGYQMKMIMEQRYIKPYLFNINGFLDNYYMNDRIQQQLIRKDTYILCQKELKIYLYFITKEQIDTIFNKGDIHYAATTITLLDKFRLQIHGQTAETQHDDENQMDQQDLQNQLKEKQEYFIELLSQSNSFSQITKIDTPLPLSLKSVKQLLKSRCLSHSFDIQKHVTELEVDQEYFDLFVLSKYYKSQTKIIIPRLAQQQKQESQNSKQNAKDSNQSSQNTWLDIQKLDLNSLERLNSIVVQEPIKDKDFLTKLFSIENIKFNRDLTSDKIQLKELDQSQFKHIFEQNWPGMDWDILLDLLEKSKQIDGEIYEKLLLNKSAHFFITQIIIPETLTEEKAGDLITSINKSCRKTQQKLHINKLVIRQFPQSNQKEGTDETSKNDQANEIKQFLSSVANLKLIEFSSKVKFGMNEAMVLINNTRNTDLSEQVISWIIPKLSKQDLEKFLVCLMNDREIPKNLSFISFKQNPYIFSHKALEQQINELRSNKKNKKTENKEGQEQQLEEEDDDKKEKEDKNNDKEEKQDDGEGPKDEGEVHELNNQSQHNLEENNQENVDGQEQDQDNKQVQKEIDSLLKNSITEDYLVEFLQNFKGLREIDFQGTNFDIHHLKSLKTLPLIKKFHFINFKDCKSFTDGIPFIWLIHDDTKPWFQFQKYLSNLPIEQITNQRQMIKAIFNCKFFKRHLKYFDVDFILKRYQEASQELIDLFSYIIKMRVPNLDITSFMQCLPLYMKQFINDNHLEQICKVYGNLLYLQPELFPTVEYGFNYILQQKNIPTAIRLMYLLNNAFQKKVSAASLSIIYQVAIKSEELQEKKYILENDQQLEKFFVQHIKKLSLKRSKLVKKIQKFKKIFDNQQDQKNMKILQALGKKKNIKRKTTTKPKAILDTSTKNLDKSNNQSNINSQMLRGQNDEEEEEQFIKLVQQNIKSNEQDEEIENLRLENREDERQEYEQLNQYEEIRNQDQENENEKEDENENEEGDGEGEGEGENNDEDNPNDNEDQDGNEENVDDKVNDRNNDDDNDEDKDKDKDNDGFKMQKSYLKDKKTKQKGSARLNSLKSSRIQSKNSQRNEDDEYNNEDSEQKRLNDESEKVQEIVNKERKDSLPQTDMETFYKTPQIAKQKSKFDTNSSKKKIKHNFEGKISTHKNQVKNNLVRIYENQAALQLHKQLINLHLLSEGLKTQIQKSQIYERKLKDVEHKLDYLEFELEILRFNKNNFFALEVNNLFNFFEVLNLGKNNHLNIYGLNYYVAEHILPWIKMNQNLNEMKDGQQRTQKILNYLKNNDDQNQDDFEAVNVLNPDHSLDDKLIEQLSYLIEKRLKQLRQIDLCGLNVSDDFAEKFSLLLSDDGKLKYLTLLDLSNNRRISPFGLKFLFSSIVNRIPQGFRIVLSSTSNDSEDLRIQIELLEKSILKEAVYIIEQQKKEIQRFINKNKKKLSKPIPQDLIRKPSIDIDMHNDNKHQKLNMEIKDLNIPVISDIFSDENEKKEEEIIDKEVQINDYDSIDSEEERKDRLKKGELQFFFLKERTLDAKIVKKLEKSKNFKQKIERLRQFQLAYTKSIQESRNKDIVTDNTDVRLIVQNIVNLGLYQSINIFVRDNWKRHKFFIIFISTLFFPFTVFHLMMVSTYGIFLFIQKNKISLRCSFCKYGKNKVKIELDKLVPDNIQSTDFFFDEDVAQVDILLSRNNQKKMPNDIARRNGRLICEYLNHPNKLSFQTTYDKINDNTNREINMLKYFDFIIIFNFLIFTVFICVVYTYYLIFYYIPNNIPQNTCGSIPVLYDVPFYAVGLFIVVYEATLLYNIEKVIVSKNIFQFKSLFVLFQLYNSFMQRYNLYTDMIFALNTIYCNKAPDLGSASFIILSIHLVLQTFYLFVAISKIYEAKKKIKNRIPVHNTTFINIYTKISLIQDFSGLSIVLDRFSTSSTISLGGIFVPKQLENVKVPQILITKFQKVFLEDIPQMILVLIFNLRFAQSTNLLDWQNLRVLVTTVLSMYNSLNSAWQAHPSIFRTYQMQDYINFRQDISEVYKIKISQNDQDTFTHLSIPKVISKTLYFNQKYKIKKELSKGGSSSQKPRKKEQKDKDAQSSKGPNSVIGSQNALSDNKSVAQSQKSLQASEQSIKSKVSSKDQQQAKKSNKPNDKSQKELSESEFKQKLIQFLLEKESQQN
ncbi:hypothetical protein ABPG72_007056 [Tetrahymena utriculariae]